MNPIQVFAQEDSGENLSEIDKLYKSLSPEDQKRIETEELDEAIKSGRVKTGVRVKEGYGVDLFVGAKFGLGTTRIGDKKEGVFETNPLAGLFIGLNGERIGFMIEGIWSMDNFTTGTSLQNTGQNIKNQVEDSLNAWSFKFHKISIPVLINFKLTEHFWLQTGPQFSAPLSNIADFKTTGNELFIDGSKAWVTGFWLNVGKSRYLPKLNLGARYALGLDGILDGRTNNINELSQFQLHLGLSY